MRIICIFYFMMLGPAAFTQINSSNNKQTIANKFTLVIHGGAGTILKKNMSAEKEMAYLKSLDSALQAGYKVLAAGGSALNAVETAIKIMEDNPLFNAGKGSVFTNEGKNEMDAAIMDGKTLKAGSVAGVTTIKNPITAARAVMEKSEHVMMAGKGAEKFAALNGCKIVDPSYFYTEDRWKGLQKAKQDDSLKAKSSSSLKQPSNRDYKYGTVGAVAVDMYGNLAAATSTGGMTNKKYGRIGDAPIIGAGTYADNNTCAISCTGWGEYFIRLVMAKSIADKMEYGNMSLKDAANEMVMKKLPALGGDGGLVAVDKDGNIAMPFCTEGMYRGFIKSTGEKVIMIYKN
ncbi:MAG: isoaspartyl peptidase/L-asparaginase [Chitinophagaceae bacterium]|nr:isoaspartyl peptidase/L-asparaginase [Chitinophagaceae bacterium]